VRANPRNSDETGDQRQHDRASLECAESASELEVLSDGEDRAHQAEVGERHPERGDAERRLAEERQLQHRLRVADLPPGEQRAEHDRDRAARSEDGAGGE
jgi:hypothetical protein